MENDQEVIIEAAAKQSAWREYYEKKVERFGSIEVYQERREKENTPYFETVSEELWACAADGHKPRLGVLGVGFGTELAVFGKKEIDCVGIDDEWVFPLAQENLFKAGVPESKVSFVMGNALNIPLADSSLDVICSHGLLEHFKDEKDVKSSIIEALRVADTYVCVVPLENAKNPEYRKVLGLSPLTAINATGNFGDEVYRPGAQWEEIINDALADVPGGQMTGKFGYWVPKLGSTFTHPQTREEAAQLYENGETIYGVYVVTKAKTPNL